MNQGYIFAVKSWSVEHTNNIGKECIVVLKSCL